MQFPGGVPSVALTDTGRSGLDFDDGFARVGTLQHVNEGLGHVDEAFRVRLTHLDLALQSMGCLSLFTFLRLKIIQKK